MCHEIPKAVPAIALYALYAAVPELFSRRSTNAGHHAPGTMNTIEEADKKSTTRMQRLEVGITMLSLSEARTK